MILMYFNLQPQYLWQNNEDLLVILDYFCYSKYINGYFFIDISINPVR